MGFLGGLTEKFKGGNVAVGIDIGSHSIKLAKMRHDVKGYHLLACFL